MTGFSAVQTIRTIPPLSPKMQLAMLHTGKRHEEENHNSSNLFIQINTWKVNHLSQRALVRLLYRLVASKDVDIAMKSDLHTWDIQVLEIISPEMVITNGWFELVIVYNIELGLYRNSIMNHNFELQCVCTGCQSSSCLRLCEDLWIDKRANLHEKNVVTHKVFLSL